MRKEKIEIFHIPSIIWGEKSKKVIIAVHGNMSNKEDSVIELLAKEATISGYQVLSFDLPEHGERISVTSYPCKVQNCVHDLKIVLDYAKKHYETISLWACSMGAYFSMLAFNGENLEKCIFLSPVVNMKIIIDSMMKAENITEELLKEKQEIKTNLGATLYFDYYEYVKNYPIDIWNKSTFILYGSNDNLQNEDIIKDFCKKNNCNLTILKDGEHYFHTGEQLEFYKKWLIEVIN